MKNIDIVHSICDLLDDSAPRRSGRSRRDLIVHVADRPGHDYRYSIDWSRAERDLAWRPTVAMDDGLRQTVAWYLANRDWLKEWSRTYAGDRLGLENHGR